jgi:hypothetical protein
MTEQVVTFYRRNVPPTGYRSSTFDRSSRTGIGGGFLPVVGGGDWSRRGRVWRPWTVDAGGGVLRGLHWNVHGASSSRMGTKESAVNSQQSDCRLSISLGVPRW